MARSDYPESRPTWRERSVNPPGAPPSTSRGSSDGGGSGPRWGVILAVVFGIGAGLMLLLVFGLSSQLQQEESGRLSAEQEAAQAAQQRNEAIGAANDAIARANQETVLRATAEAEQSESELVAQQETALRATAVADRLAAEQVAQEETRLRATAEAKAQLAESETTRESRLRATAEAETRQSERQRSADHTEAERELALELARTSPTIKAIATGELKVHFEPLPWYAGDNAEQALQDVVDSLDGRNHHGARIQVTDSEDAADIYVRWVRDYGTHTLGLAVHQTVIHVGLGSTNCNDEWQAFDRNTVVKVLWHELGHTLGYGHSDDPNNIMYPTTETRFELERDISRVIAAGWIWRFPLCRAGRYSIGLETDSDDDGFEVIVARGFVDWDDYHDGDYDAYGSCVNGRWHQITRTCDVEGGAYVYVENYDRDDAIRVSGQIIQLDDPPWPDMQWDEDAFYYDEETLDYYRELFAEE